MSIDNPLLSINSEATKLALAIGNMLGNAIRFSPDNDVVILSAASKNSKVEIQITDFDTGVAPKVLTKLFNRFNTDGSGTGMGLALSGELINQLGGETGYTRNENKTTFWISIPT